jgi:hypothetical protein
MLDIDSMRDCLDVCGAIYHVEITERLVDLYWQTLIDLDSQAVTTSVAKLIEAPKFPTPAKIRETVTGEAIEDDWLKIMGVVQETIKSAQISAISADALMQATSTTGFRSALIAIGRADDSYKISQYRTTWIDLVRRRQPRPNDLCNPPVTITLDIPTSQQDIDYPCDPTCKVQTDSLIKLVRQWYQNPSEGIKPSTAIGCSAKFPSQRKQELAVLFEELGIDLDRIDDRRDIVPSFSIGSMVSARRVLATSGV